MTASDAKDLFSSGALGGLGDLLSAARDRLAASQVEASAGGGAVHVTMDGERRLKSIVIDPAVFEDGDADALQELILAACNEAWDKAGSAKSSALDGLLPGIGGLR